MWIFLEEHCLLLHPILYQIDIFVDIFYFHSNLPANRVAFHRDLLQIQVDTGKLHPGQMVNIFHHVCMGSGRIDQSHIPL